MPEPEIPDVVVTWSDHYNLKNGHKPMPPIPTVEYASILKDFTDGLSSMQDTAKALITALYYRDFNSKDTRWSHYGADASLFKTHPSGAESYKCEKIAEWEHKDICAQARARGIITLSFDRKRIRIDDYSFYCAG